MVDRRADDASHPRGRVMMADDDANDHLLLTMAVRRTEAKIEIAHVGSGDALIFELKRQASLGQRPDLVVLDLRMPGLDGHTTLRLIKVDPSLRGIPVAIFSSSTRRSDRQESLEGGASWVDVKPSDSEEMETYVLQLEQRVFELRKVDQDRSPGSPTSAEAR